jgi:DNA-binding transcriptional ArsR family regulator
MEIAAFKETAPVAAEFLKVMANESRLGILCNLLDGEKSVNELEVLLDMRQSTLSQHLSVLRRERLVSTRRSAQYIYYSLASREAEIIMQALYGIYCAKDENGKTIATRRKD